MKDRIEQQLRQIWDKLLQVGDSGKGLYTGQEGILLFQTLYAAYKNIDDWQPIESGLNLVFESGFDKGIPTMGYGRAGTCWFLLYLAQKGVIDTGDLDHFFYDDLALQQYALHALSHGNYDFLFGSTGICFLYLFRRPEQQRSFFPEIFRLLQQQMSQPSRPMLRSYDQDTGKTHATQVDLGLAHGISSVLKLCITCYTEEVCSDSALNTGRMVIDFLLASIKQDTAHSFFPNETGGADDQFNSRLGWCYGDLSIAFVLYQAGKAFSLPEVSAQALAILRAGTVRRSEKETMIYDSGICHGSAGVAHLYYKLWHYTGDPLFEETAAYWIGRTLDGAQYNEGTILYPKYNPGPEAPAREAPGLLEGAAGIGLVLLSYLNGDHSWDYCLMLGD